MNQQNNYYCVIPWFVLSSEEINAHEKLIYGEISSLANKFGYCYASNKHFADVFKLKKQTISSYISRLEKQKFISIDFDEKTQKRRIFLKHDPMKIIIGGYENNHRVTYIENNKEIINKLFLLFGKEINKKSRLTDGAKRKIKARLKTYKPKELAQAIVNFSKNDWWMKNNSHRGIAWFFYSDDRIDQFLNLKIKDDWR